jgi:hypothetical protein
MSVNLESGQWWRAPEERQHEYLRPLIDRIDSADRGRRERLVRYARLYGNREIRGLAADEWQQEYGADTRLRYNLVRSVVQSWTAKIAKMRPRPLFLTVAGDYSLQRRAKQLTRFLDGEFSRANLYTGIGPAVARDGAVFGAGVVKIYASGTPARLQYERVYPWELSVDPIEAYYGDPRSLYQRKAIDRYQLAEMFPKQRAEILDDKKTPRTTRDSRSRDTTSDMVDVLEGWHRRSSTTADDGQHVIATAGATLLTEPYERDRFPFSVYMFEAPIVGWWGDGMVEEILPIQFELNLSLEKMQECLHLMGVPRVFVERGARVQKQHINNDIGTVLEYTGAKPDFATPASVPPELPGHIAQLKADGFEVVGVSRLGAQSMKPAGLNSGRALRAYEDIETERFAIQARAYEAFFLDMAHQAVETISEISRRDKGYTIKAYDHRSVQILDWADVELDEDASQLRMFPTSLLPTQPQAKLQSVQELIDSGMMGREDGMRLLDFPDLDAYTSLELAAYEIIDSMIETMIDDGEYVSPEPYIPLEWGRKRVQQAYLAGKRDGVPEDHLALLRQWIDDATALLEPPAPPAAEPIPGGLPSESPPLPPTELFPSGGPPGLLQ